MAMDRRTFIATSTAAAAALSIGDVFAQSKSKQTFSVGVVAAAPRLPGAPAPGAPGAQGAGRGGGQAAQTDQQRVEAFLRGMDDCQRLGIHYIEKSNGPDPLVNFYKGNENAFKDELAKRNLKLAGLANNCHAGRAELRQTMIDQNIRTGKFIQKMGGHYVALVLDPTEGSDGSGNEEAFRKLDYKVVASNVDEMARTCKEETGVTVGYHPEEGDSAAGFVDYLMQNTKNLMFWPDIGWMQMAGMDSVATCKKYYSRMNGMHMRDFAKPADGGAARTGMKALGEGEINLAALMDFLRQQKFTGFVMAEGQGNESNYRYMHDKLGLEF
jgi:sugar phosphate isomerase/epimerase